MRTTHRLRSRLGLFEFSRALCLPVISIALIFAPVRMQRAAAEAAPAKAGWKVEGQHGQASLLSIGGQRVLILKGTPYEMGLQHGKLLAKEAAEDARAYLHDWFVEKAGQSISSLRETFESLRPFIPKDYMEEMRGLAEGSGIPLGEIHLLHAIPTRFHCTGAAAFGKATVDGRLYHTRSLDYSLDIGEKKKAQENAVVIVYQPINGNAHVVVSWAGLIGCVSGMNAKGISIGEIGSACRDESYAGMPMIFMLREALRKCNALDEVVAFIAKSPRTCGFTFVVGDGKIPSARALEVSHSRMAVGVPGDQESEPPPHFPIPDAIRRGNYFVDKTMAAIQRDVYDPQVSSPADWLGYSVMSQFILENYGRLNETRMVELLRKYPPEHHCLHQVVFCPSALDFWVSNAVSPSKAKFAGAQNQPFYKYNLLKLIQGEPFDVEVAEPPSRVLGQLPPPETGTVAVPDSEQFLGDSALRQFRVQRKNFQWVLTYDFAAEKYFVADLSFPSEIQTPWPETNTVFGEYYLPKTSGKLPAVIVLDIMQGNFVVARAVARTLAENGIAALPLHIPLFGKRQPRGDARASMLSGDIASTRQVISQAVLDIRSAALWLKARKEVDPRKTGIVGVSLGGVIGALAIGVEDSFTKNALVLGGGDIAQIVWMSPETNELKEQLLKKGYTLEKLREELKPVDPLTYAHRIKPGTLIMFNAKNDRTVIAGCTVRFWEEAGRPKIFWYDTTHLGMALYTNKILEEVIAFVRE